MEKAGLDVSICSREKRAIPHHWARPQRPAFAGGFQPRLLGASDHMYPLPLLSGPSLL